LGRLNCIAIKLLHAPESTEDIDFAERLLNYYCRTISEVYDQSLEYYSLHGHLHLPAQVRLHGEQVREKKTVFTVCLFSIKNKFNVRKQYFISNFGVYTEAFCTLIIDRDKL
jgi:hypothetical protein